MSEIDLAEFNSREAAKFSQANLDQARTKAHQLLVLLLGGGAGLGALGLDRWESSVVLASAAFAASAWWFLEAFRVARNAGSSAPVQAWTQQGLLNKHEQWVAYSAELLAEGKETVNPLEELRKSSLRSTDLAADGYRTASTAAYSAMDAAYKRLAFTPAVAIGGALVPLLAKC